MTGSAAAPPILPGVARDHFRLLVISGAFPPIRAPESAHTLHLCQHLARRGLDVHLVTTRGVRVSGEEIPANLKVHPIMPGWGWLWLPLLALCVRKIAPDAVLLIYIDWIYRCHPMITFAPTFLRSALSENTPVVTQFENESGLSETVAPSNFRARLLQRLAERLAGTRDVHTTYGTLLRDSTQIIALSERHREAFERALPRISEKSTVAPAPPILFVCPSDEGMARKRGRQKLGISSEQTLLVYFGYIYRSKGLETLMHAFGEVCGRNAQARLVVVGGGDDGYVRDLQRIAEQSGAADDILWMGHCESEAEASLYLHAADLCVLPFDVGVRLNNSSIAVAAAHALPIVSTRGETLETPFVDGENIRLCPPKNPAALAEAIIELMERPDLRALLSAGATRLARECFSWDRVIDSTLETLGIGDRFSSLEGNRAPHKL